MQRVRLKEFQNMSHPVSALFLCYLLVGRSKLTNLLNSALCTGHQLYPHGEKLIVGKAEHLSDYVKAAADC